MPRIAPIDFTVDFSLLSEDNESLRIYSGHYSFNGETDGSPVSPTFFPVEIPIFRVTKLISTFPFVDMYQGQFVNKEGGNTVWVGNHQERNFIIIVIKNLEAQHPHITPIISASREDNFFVGKYTNDDGTTILLLDDVEGSTLRHLSNFVEEKLHSPYSSLDFDESDFANNLLSPPPKTRV